MADLPEVGPVHQQQPFWCISTVSLVSLTAAGLVQMTFLVQVDLQEHHQKACLGAPAGVINGRVGKDSLTW